MAKEGEIPREKNIDTSELAADYQLCKREEFEYLVRRYRRNTSVWIKYAGWEESQKDFARARSVWERTIECNFGNHMLWLKYAEMELKNKFINHARNVLDRAVSLFPLIIQIWHKYIQIEEEMLHNGDGARDVFEQWMRWKPDQQAWLSYIEFELRNNEIERARGIFERFVECHPKVGVWIRFAKFEIKNEEVSRARKCYEMAVKKLITDDEEAKQLLVSFEVFEKLCKEECKESTGSAASASVF